MFVQIQFNHITMKNSFMITVQRVKTKFGQNVLWTFVFQTVQSGTVWYSLVQSGTVWYSLVQSGTVWYSLVQVWYSLVQSLHFSTHASSKQNSQRQNMVKFYSIKHRKFNLRFLCYSVYYHCNKDPVI